MKDNTIIKIILPIIRQGLKDQGYEYVSVMQNYQPTQQGIPSQPTVFFHKVSSHQYGFVSSFYFKDESENKLLKQTQMIEARWQFSTLVQQIPSNTDQYTSYDLAQEIFFILQNSITVQNLLQYNIGLLKITDIINPYFSQDRDQYQANAYLDVILTYPDERIYKINEITPPCDFQLIEV